MIPHFSEAGFFIHLQASTYMYALKVHRYPQPPVLSWSLCTHNFIHVKGLLVVLWYIKNV